MIIRPVELSDEFTDRDNYNELILYFIPLGKFFFSRNCASFLVEEITQLCADFNVLEPSRAQERIVKPFRKQDFFYYLQQGI